jgi:hypothetical protein
LSIAAKILEIPLIPFALLSIIFVLISLIKSSIVNLLSSSMGTAYEGPGAVTK